MTFTSCTDEVRGKVPSFQKVTLFIQYKIFNRDGIRLHFCLFEDVNDFCNFKRSGSKKVLPQSDFSLLLRNNISQTLSAA